MLFVSDNKVFNHMQIGFN